MKKAFWYLVLFFGAIIIFGIIYYRSRDYDKTVVEKVTVSRVVDGDTIEVFDGKETKVVRLIGIDAPEIGTADCFGQESYGYVSQELENRVVWLFGDENLDNMDKYGRLLRYVYGEGGTNINLSLIEKGYAREYYYMGINYQLRDEFYRKESVAKLNKAGLWGQCE